MWAVPYYTFSHKRGREVALDLKLLLFRSYVFVVFALVGSVTIKRFNFFLSVLSAGEGSPSTKLA